MSRPAKRLLFFSDGTGNTVIKGRGTNVFKLYEAVDLAGHRFDPELSEQIAFYDDGVGSEENKLLKLLGGAFGFGLARNVRELYTSFCRAYQPGDEVYLFGFSRGAFTIRTLAGLITECGAIQHAATKEDSELDKLVGQAWKAFRLHFGSGRQRPASGETAGDQATRWFRERHAREIPNQESRRVPIRFVGVWDTVAAVGFPIAHFADFWDHFIYPFKFPNYRLSPLVTKACHALSIDDERHTFHPLLWDERGETTNRIEQVWFAGVHSNVGGGYLKQGLSLVPLEWMMLQAAAAGLRFNKGEIERFRGLANVHDKLYNSRSGLAGYYRYKPRDIARLCHENGVEPKVHVSALERIALGTQGYAPGNLPETFTVVPSDLKGNAPGEDAATLAQVVARWAMKDASPHRPLLLDQTRFWVNVRRGLHYLTLLLTVAVLAGGLYLRSQLPPAGASTLAGWSDRSLKVLMGSVPMVGAPFYEHVLNPYLIHQGVSLVLLLVMAGIYTVGRFARGKLRRRYSAFWRGALPGSWRT